MTPERILTWIDGSIHEPDDARVSVFDRGFLYGDAVYELVRFFDDVGMGMDLHIERLRRSLDRTGITGFDPGTYPSICRTLMDALETSDACIYLQVSRGVQVPRRHAPDGTLSPTVVAIGSTSAPLSELEEPIQVPIIVLPDLRRRSCDIKATSLIENVMATIQAVDADAAEPILHEDGLLTEGGSSNVFVVRNGTLLTPALGDPRPILEGVTRRFVVEAAVNLGIEVMEGDVPVDALREADEAFVTSSRRLLGTITSVDGRQIGDGRPGAVTMQVFEEVRRIIQTVLENEHAH